jgi:hypothetical protein
MRLAASLMSKSQRKAEQDNRVSLHGIDPEDALRKALSTPPLKKDAPENCPRCGEKLTVTRNGLKCETHGLFWYNAASGGWANRGQIHGGEE